jgi:hypothetical protein
MYFCLLNTNMKLKNGGRNRKYRKIAKNSEKLKFSQCISENIDFRNKVSHKKMKNLKNYKKSYVHILSNFNTLVVIVEKLF